MNLYFHTVGIKEHIINTDEIRHWINLVIKENKKSGGEINIILSSDEYLLALNKNYLNHHYYTDIITFNYNEDNLISGDIFISFDRVKENAESFKNSLNEELKRVIIHGILHLLGYDDSSEEEIKEMRNQENIYIKYVKELIII